MTYDPTKLDGELKAAGLAIYGCAALREFREAAPPSAVYQAQEAWVRIDWVALPTAAQEATAQQVLVAHDPTPRRVHTIQEALIVQAAGGVVPAWATEMILAKSAEIKAQNGQSVPGPGPRNP